MRVHYLLEDEFIYLDIPMKYSEHIDPVERVIIALVIHDGFHYIYKVWSRIARTSPDIVQQVFSQLQDQDIIKIENINNVLYIHKHKVLFPKLVQDYRQKYNLNKRAIQPCKM